MSSQIYSSKAKCRSTIKHLNNWQSIDLGTLEFSMGMCGQVDLKFCVHVKEHLLYSKNLGHYDENF